ncbi:chondrolectin-like [Saccoglossus kowalevskii]|uniref:Macrophage mannose receptor 1-like n=1 Tax=Saccoglossus kowalevskii TaxID=10224 RepID=A0ABM0M7X8_SACKO|nr:PREDICTED: macrophage mannose receptor 1-like [Saccoglossus kowalevskii]
MMLTTISLAVIGLFLVVTPVEMNNPEVGCYRSCRCLLYKVFCRNDHSTWDWSKDYCENLGGSLATIDQQSTHKAIKKIIKETEGVNERKCHNWGFWIGYYDPRDPKPSRHKAHPELFEWLQTDPPCVQFVKWAENQPNDQIEEDAGGQNCVQLWYKPKAKGDFDDEYCYEKKGFVCMFEEECPCANDSCE